MQTHTCLGHAVRRAPAQVGAEGRGQASAHVEGQELLLAQHVDGGAAKAVEGQHVAEQVHGRHVGEGRRHHGVQPALHGWQGLHACAHCEA